MNRSKCFQSGMLLFLFSRRNQSIIFPTIFGVFALSIGVLLGGSAGKESASQHRRCGRPRFNPWTGKIPWSRKWQLTTVFLLGKFHGQSTVHGVAKSQTGVSTSTMSIILLNGCWSSGCGCVLGKFILKFCNSLTLILHLIVRF